MAQDQSVCRCPRGVKAVWDPAKARHETTPTRERLCINGLWRWQPAAEGARRCPTAGWGYHQVPASGPAARTTCTTTTRSFTSPKWNNTKLSQVQRRLVPETHHHHPEMGRAAYRPRGRVSEFVRGGLCGWPQGRPNPLPGGRSGPVLSRPSGRHPRFNLHVVAMPLKAVTESNNDTNTARKSEGTVERRGLCGDIWLIGEPVGARLADVEDRNVRPPGPDYVRGRAAWAGGRRALQLRARITDQGRQVAEFTGPTFPASEVKDGRGTFTASWKPPKLWDLNTPQNQYPPSYLSSTREAGSWTLRCRFGSDSGNLDPGP